MNRNDLSILAVFLAVAEERSFTRAGKKLGVSPSAISHTIRATNRHTKKREKCLGWSVFGTVSGRPPEPAGSGSRPQPKFVTKGTVCEQRGSGQNNVGTMQRGQQARPWHVGLRHTKKRGKCLGCSVFGAARERLAALSEWASADSGCALHTPLADGRDHGTSASCSSMAPSKKRSNSRRFHSCNPSQQEPNWRVRSSRTRFCTTHAT
jgi:hypothetical protein